MSRKPSIKDKYDYKQKYEELLQAVRWRADYSRQEWEKAKADVRSTEIGSLSWSERERRDAMMHGLYSALKDAGEGDDCPCDYCADQRTERAASR